MDLFNILKSKTFLSLLFASVLMSCSDNDDSLPEIISKDDAGQLGYTVQCPDTLFFHNLGESQTLNVTIRDANNNVLDASAIKYAPFGIGFTVSDNQITVNEKVLEKPVQTMTFNCKLPNTTLRDEIVIVFIADTSRNTKESRTIYVKEPGTLSSLIVKEDYKQIKKLTLYGQLNTKDQIFLRKLLGGEETIAKFDLIDYEGGFGYMIPYEQYFNDLTSEYSLEYLDLRNTIYVDDDRKEYYYPGKYTVIGDYNDQYKLNRYLFAMCINLKELYLPDYIKVMMDGITEECPKLEFIHLPNNLQELCIEGNTAKNCYAFNHCQNLYTIEINENNEYFTVDENGMLYSKDKSVLYKYPGGRKNSVCKIPKGTTLQCYALGYAYNLRDVYFYDETPIYAYGSPFTQNIKDITIHVPAGSIEAYKEKYPECKSIVEIESE